jgi:hypothetical protein
MLPETQMKKVLGVLFSALLVFATLGSVDTAQARSGRIGAFAGGAVLGTVLGATIANSNRGYGYDNCDAYGNCYPRRAYYRPVYRGLRWSDEEGCYVSRYDWPYGPCRR